MNNIPPKKSAKNIKKEDNQMAKVYFLAIMNQLIPIPYLSHDGTTVDARLRLYAWYNMVSKIASWVLLPSAGMEMSLFLPFH